jgi:hypothetical protein
MLYAIDCYCDYQPLRKSNVHLIFYEHHPLCVGRYAFQESIRNRSSGSPETGWLDQ